MTARSNFVAEQDIFFTANKGRKILFFYVTIVVSLNNLLWFIRVHGAVKYAKKLSLPKKLSRGR